MPPTTPAIEALRTLPHRFEILGRTAGKDWVGVKEEWKNTLRAAVLARNDSTMANSAMKSSRL
jgi:hypothetical protein